MVVLKYLDNINTDTDYPVYFLLQRYCFIMKILIIRDSVH